MARRVVEDGRREAVVVVHRPEPLQHLLHQAAGEEIIVVRHDHRRRSLDPAVPGRDADQAARPHGDRVRLEFLRDDGAEIDVAHEKDVEVGGVRIVHHPRTEMFDALRQRGEEGPRRPLPRPAGQVRHVEAHLPGPALHPVGVDVHAVFEAEHREEEAADEVVPVDGWPGGRRDRERGLRDGEEREDCNEGAFHRLHSPLRCLNEMSLADRGPVCAGKSNDWLTS